MFELELFLGLEVTPELKKRLDACNQHLTSTFIKNGSDYLHHTKLHNKNYIGKHLGSICNLKGFDFLCTNIYSILKQLTNSPCESYPLILFAIPKDE